MEFKKVLDSGERQEFDTGSVRDTQNGKGRPELIPPWGLIRLAKHYENGAAKYGDHNWTKGQPISRYVASMFRHMIKFMGGCQDEDHLAAIAWNALSIIDHQERIARGLLDESMDDMRDWPKSFIPGEFDPKKTSKPIVSETFVGKVENGVEVIVGDVVYRNENGLLCTISQADKIGLDIFKDDDED